MTKVPNMTLIERLRYPLIAANNGQSYFDAERALRKAAANRIEELEAQIPAPVPE